MQERHIHDLVDAYALGALEPQEVDAVEQHLQTCAECRTLIDEARMLGEQMLYDAPQVAPPPSLRARVMARIATERAAAHGDAESSHSATNFRREDADVGIYAPEVQRAPLSGNPFERFFRTILGDLPSDEHQSGDLLRELLAEPDCAIWPVAGTDDAPGASARLIGTPSRRDAVLITNGLHRLKQDQAYQVWFLKGGQPAPNALFSVNRAGTGVSIVRAQQPLRNLDLVAVTPEPATGSPAPTGAIVLAGSLAMNTAKG